MTDKETNCGLKGPAKKHGLDFVSEGVPMDLLRQENGSLKFN